LARALDLHSRGQGFDSLILHNRAIRRHQRAARWAGALSAGIAWAEPGFKFFGMLGKCVPALRGLVHRSQK
jgi:hypothetical protein